MGIINCTCCDSGMMMMMMMMVMMMMMMMMLAVRQHSGMEKNNDAGNENDNNNDCIDDEVSLPRQPVVQQPQYSGISLTVQGQKVRLAIITLVSSDSALFGTIPYYWSSGNLINLSNTIA